MTNSIKKKIKFLFFIFNHYLKLFFDSLYFLNKKKVINVDAVFAYNSDYRNQEGAYGYLHYYIKMISKYSRFSFKNLTNLNYKSYRRYKIKKLIIFLPQSLGFDIKTAVIILLFL